MSRLIISNAALHGRVGTWDLTILEDRVVEIVPHDPQWPIRQTEETLEAAGGLLGRAFAEPHIHPDKSYSLGDLPDGVDVTALDSSDTFLRAARIKAGFTAENVERRARRAFELALRNGVTQLRATADVDSLAGIRGVEGLLRAREAMASVMDIEIVAFPQEGLQRDPGTLPLLREALALGVDAIGGWPNVEADSAAECAHVSTVFDLAAEFDVDIDIHADCFLDPAERALEVIAKETIQRGYQGRVLASHCAALELYEPADAARVIDLVARAGITIAVIPLNLAHGGPRGLSRPQQLLDAGVTVVAGSDNMNDGWYPLGTLNPLDRATMTFLGGSFHTESDVDVVWNMITGGASGGARASAPDVVEGQRADLVLHTARSRTEALEHPLSGLVTIHRGRVVARRSVTDHWFAGASPSAGAGS